MSLLMEDKSLLVFPLLSSVAMLLVIASFAAPVVPSVELWSRGAEAIPPLTYVALFAFYWLQYSIVIFFNTALIEVALDRFDGQDASIGDGLRRALSQLSVIIAYALIAATVGLILRVIAERVGIIGRIVISLIGLAWSVATALVAPVLAAEDVGPIEAIERSVELIKKAWGEDIIGSAGIGLVFGALIFFAVLVGGSFVLVAFAAHNTAAAVLLIVASVLVVSLLGLVQATLHGVYSAALYRYANGDPAAGGIEPRLLEDAFRARG